MKKGRIINNNPISNNNPNPLNQKVNSISKIISSNDINIISNNNFNSNSDDYNDTQNLQINKQNKPNEVEMSDFIKEKGPNNYEKNFDFKLSDEEITKIIRKGQTKITLNNSANKMIEDIRGLSAELFESLENLSVKCNDNTTNLLKSASEHKRKIDSYVTDPTERNKNIEILKYLRDQISNKQN